MVSGTHTSQVGTRKAQQSRGSRRGHPQSASPLHAGTNAKALSPALKGRLVRTEAAMQNHFDNMGLFAAAVVAGNVAKLSPTT